MEGLLIAAELARLAPRLPVERLAWRFFDDATLVLPLVPSDALWIVLHPSAPRAVLGEMPSDSQGPSTSFARALHARASGPLVGVEQFALDRRFVLRFGASDGFVPVAGIDLMIELTGRNANALLLDADERIVAVHREVGAARNRHRQLLAGLPYRPPPPYDKLDPRATDERVLASALRGRPLNRAFGRIDGVGTVLTRAWAHLAGVDPAAALEGAALDAAVDALARLVADPAGAVAEADAERAAPLDPASQRARTRREALEASARRALASRRTLLERRLADTEKALAAADDAARLRSEGDLLLAHAHALPPRGNERVTLEGFDGDAIEVRLDPAIDVAANARKRYEQARKREARAERALEQHDRVRREHDEVLAAEAGLGEASEETLHALGPDSARPAVRRESVPGIRVIGPHGFEIVIGRSARENDVVTFRIGRSDDLWLHAQGYHGAHVVIRARGQEVPFDTVLFAAQLAAGHSDAGGSDNVPVDYTHKKHVWRSKGAPAGAVSFAQQKTVYVTPLRRSQVE